MKSPRIKGLFYPISVLVNTRVVSCGWDVAFLLAWKSEIEMPLEANILDNSHYQITNQLQNSERDIYPSDKME